MSATSNISYLLPPHRTKVLYQDRVRTRSGRVGICLKTIGVDVAQVQWDDGEIFPIRFCHLEVLQHNCEIPKRFSKRALRN